MLNVAMLSVENKPFMLSVFKLNVIMLSVFKLNVIMLNVVAPMVFQNVLAYFANKNYACKILYHLKFQCQMSMAAKNLQISNISKFPAHLLKTASS
jgi:hypothetical protein